MANRRYNTQTRKMFDKGTGRPGTLVGGKNTKAKDMLDRNPNRTMSPETKRRLNDAILKKRKQDEIKKNIERSNKQKEARSKKPITGKPKDKKMERRTKAIEPVNKPKKNTIKDKLKKVGDMKVKDAAKAVGKGILAATPVGAVKNAADTFKKNFKFQSPIVSRKDRKFGGR